MHKGSIISKIIECKKVILEVQKKMVSENDLLSQIKNVGPVRNFAYTISEYVKNKEIGIISEVKKAVPVKGILRKYFNLNRIIKSFEQSGSVSIAINTEESVYFGRKEFLREAKSFTNLPILRQDIIFDQYQIIESRVYGADAISLNLSVTAFDLALRLEKVAKDLEMDVILEVNDIKQLDIAQKFDSKIISIDNRDQRTLELNIDTTKDFAAKLPEGYVLICKNGIQSSNDIAQLKNHNVFLFMIGEYALSKPSIKAAMEVLLKQ